MSATLSDAITNSDHRKVDIKRSPSTLSVILVKGMKLK